MVLQLHTNVPPGEGGPVAWTNTQLPSNTCGSSGKWHGSTGELRCAVDAVAPAYLAPLRPNVPA